ncbi:hypothetical protein L7F22_035990 [Adiantum nelumboides]|nr:hypothetical protein [Adiantum nelumboides]
MEHRRLVGEAMNLMVNFAKHLKLAKYMSDTAFQDVQAQRKATTTSPSKPDSKKQYSEKELEEEMDARLARILGAQKQGKKHDRKRKKSTDFPGYLGSQSTFDKAKKHKKRAAVPTSSSSDRSSESSEEERRSKKRSKRHRHEKGKRKTRKSRSRRVDDTSTEDSSTDSSDSEDRHFYANKKNFYKAIQYDFLEDESKKVREFKEGGQSIKFETFSGYKDASKALSFIEQFDIAFAGGRYSEHSKIWRAASYFKGNARTWCILDKDSGQLRIPYLQTDLGKVLRCYAAQIHPNRVELRGYRPVTQEELREMEHRRLVGEAMNLMVNFAKHLKLAKYMSDTAFQDVQAQRKATTTSPSKLDSKKQYSEKELEEEMDARLARILGAQKQGKKHDRKRKKSTDFPGYLGSQSTFEKAKKHKKRAAVPSSSSSDRSSESSEEERRSKKRSKRHRHEKGKRKTRKSRSRRVDDTSTEDSSTDSSDSEDRHFYANKKNFYKATQYDFLEDESKKVREFKEGGQSIKFETFSGYKDASKALSFIEQFDIAFAGGRYSEHSKIWRAASYFKGNARTWRNRGRLQYFQEGGMSQNDDLASDMAA